MGFGEEIVEGHGGCGDGRRGRRTAAEEESRGRARSDADSAVCSAKLRTHTPTLSLLRGLRRTLSLTRHPLLRHTPSPPPLSGTHAAATGSSPFRLACIFSRGPSAGSRNGGPEGSRGSAHAREVRRAPSACVGCVRAAPPRLASPVAEGVTQRPRTPARVAANGRGGVALLRRWRPRPARPFSAPIARASHPRGRVTSLSWCLLSVQTSRNRTCPCSTTSAST